MKLLRITPIALLPLAALADGPRDERYWAQWRGPLDTGVATKADPPVEWSETKNVKWKTALPGQGHSSPVVWEDRLFLTTAMPYGAEVDPPAGIRPGAHDNILKVRPTKFLVLAVNRADGMILWQTTVRDALPHEGHHDTGSFASASPITDGEHVYALFGSNGLYCLDFAGKVVWEKDLGEMHSKHGHGEGSSPALFGDTLVVNWDHEGPSFVAAFDKRSGHERWRRERDEPTSWSSPHVVVHDGKPQVVISATKRIRSYDLASGELIWECGGLSNNVVAGPVSQDGILICGSSYEKQIILGIKLDGAQGDLTGTEQVAWIRRRDTPYVPSLLLYSGHVYYLRHYEGVVTCLDARTGAEVYARARLANLGHIYSSPVAAQDRIYITTLGGATVVFSAGPNPEALALNRLDDSFSASAALVGNELILRGRESLYCIARK